MKDVPGAHFGIFDPARPIVPQEIRHAIHPHGLPAIRTTDGRILYGAAGGHVFVLLHFDLDVETVAGTGFIQEGVDGYRYVERRAGERYSVGCFGVFDPTRPVAPQLHRCCAYPAEGRPAVRMVDGRIFYGGVWRHDQVIRHFELDSRAIAGTGFVTFVRRSAERYVVVPGVDFFYYYEHGRPWQRLAGAAMPTSASEEVR